MRFCWISSSAAGDSAVCRMTVPANPRDRSRKARSMPWTGSTDLPSSRSPFRCGGHGCASARRRSKTATSTGVCGGGSLNAGLSGSRNPMMTSSTCDCSSNVEPSVYTSCKPICRMWKRSISSTIGLSSTTMQIRFPSGSDGGAAAETSTLSGELTALARTLLLDAELMGLAAHTTALDAREHGALVNPLCSYAGLALSSNRVGKLSLNMVCTRPSSTLVMSSALPCAACTASFAPGKPIPSE
mmetsp:Transcript_47704/g.101878  ORF Transcript_47704/g.101878 Transcript_47704/m.101878 type:complete len:243 (+) Transcript_47704:284-1012(+)